MFLYTSTCPAGKFWYVKQLNIYKWKTWKTVYLLYITNLVRGEVGQASAVIILGLQHAFGKMGYRHVAFQQLSL